MRNKPLTVGMLREILADHEPDTPVLLPGHTHEYRRASAAYPGVAIYDRSEETWHEDWEFEGDEDTRGVLVRRDILYLE